MRWHGLIQLNDCVHLLRQQVVVIAKVNASEPSMAKTDGAIRMKGDGLEFVVEADCSAEAKSQSATGAPGSNL